jgi:hypothetical protein
VSLSNTLARPARPAKIKFVQQRSISFGRSGGRNHNFKRKLKEQQSSQLVQLIQSAALKL